MVSVAVRRAATAMLGFSLKALMVAGGVVGLGFCTFPTDVVGDGVAGACRPPSMTTGAGVGAGVGGGGFETTAGGPFLAALSRQQVSC